MKSEINRVKRALAGENATSPTSRMVKTQGSRLWAYGGVFCLSVPTPLDLECGFIPEPVLAFYELKRENEVITKQDGFLKIVAGNRSIKVPCLAANEIPVLDVIGTPINGVLELDNLRRAFGFHDGTDQFTQFAGVTFADGCLYAGTQRRIFNGASGLPEDLTPFRMPPESVEALLAVKSPVTAVYLDRNAVRFDFEDDTRLCSRILEDSWPRASSRAFDGSGTTFSVDPEFLKEITKTTCQSWVVVGNEMRHYGDGSEGVLTGAVELDGEFRIAHGSLMAMLELGVTFEVTDTVLKCVGENFDGAAALMRI